MGQIEDAVRELIEDRYGSVAEFARHVGMSDQTVYTVLKKHLSTARFETAAPIIYALGLDPAALLKGQLALLPGRTEGCTSVPLLGSIAAGNLPDPFTASQSFAIPDGMHERYPDAFLLQVAGESMNRILPNGSYALVDPCTSIDCTGQPYAVIVGTESATIKRVKLLNNGIVLVPDSTDATYHPLVIDFGMPDAQPVRIVGRVVWYCLPANWDFSV